MDAWLSVRRDLVACSVSQSVHCYVCALLCLCIDVTVTHVSLFGERRMDGRVREADGTYLWQEISLLFSLRVGWILKMRARDGLERAREGRMQESLSLQADNLHKDDHDDDDDRPVTTTTTAAAAKTDQQQSSERQSIARSQIERERERGSSISRSGCGACPLAARLRPQPTQPHCRPRPFGHRARQTVATATTLQTAAVSWDVDKTKTPTLCRHETL